MSTGASPSSVNPKKLVRSSKSILRNDKRKKRRKGRTGRKVSAMKKEKVVKVALEIRILKLMKDKEPKKMERLRKVHRPVSKDLLLVLILIKIKYNLRTI